VLVRFSLFLITIKVVTARNEEVEGAETHEMYTLESHTGSVASSLFVYTVQDTNEAQPVISQIEGVTNIWPCCLIPRRLFCSVTGSEGNDAPEMNIDQSRSSDDVKGTTSDRTTQAEAQTRACFFTVVEILMTWWIQNQPPLVILPQTPHLNKILKNHA
jgi:hypothetical protein